MENSYYKGRYGISRSTLQLIAVVAMVIDHTAWRFFPGEGFLPYLMHFIGRFTMPLMCYLIGEGFDKTSDINKYLNRMIIFSLISHFPFQYYKWGYIPLWRTLIYGKLYPADAYFSTGVIYTLTLGLLSLIIIKSEKNTAVKFICILTIMIISVFGDYGYYGVIWVIIFHLFKNKKNTMMILFTAVTLTMMYPAAAKGSWFAWGVFVPLVFIELYNGEKGRKTLPKNFLYVFYPLHLIVLRFIQNVFN